MLPKSTPPTDAVRRDAVGDEMDDADVIAASLNSPARFGEIFERHYPAIRTYAWRRVRDNRADEIASETFVLAFERRDRFDAHVGSVRAWLFGIASNLLRRHWRAEERRLRAYARLHTPATVLSDDSDARVDAQRLHNVIAAALADLARRDRDVLLLHAWGELSHGEIAAALGIAEGTVRSRLSRARAVMRERIGRIGEEVDETRS